MVIPTIHSLSALIPVKFTYEFNKEEKLSNSLASYSNGFKYYKHNAFENFQDAVLSKGTCLILTNNKPLKDVFESDSKYLDVGTVAGSMFLKTSTGKYFTTKSDNIYIGGTGSKLFVNVAPIEGNIVELKPSNTTHIQIDSDYPYNARISTEILDGEDLERQRFQVDYNEGIISFKTKTKEGYRYLSYSTADQTVRAVGLMLNETVVNPYLFVPEFISPARIYYDFDEETSAVKYYNTPSAVADQFTVNIKQQQENDTNLLISCTTESIAASARVPLNISLTKTNFSSSGSYLSI